MLPPDFFDHCADDLLELYTQLDETIVRDIVRRLVKTGNITKTAKWQAERAQEAGLLFDDILQQVAALTNKSNAHVRGLFEDAGLAATEWDADIYEAAGLFPPPIRMSPSALQILRAGMNKTAGILRNLTKTTALEAQQAYIRAATLAEMQVESGAFDSVTAIRNAVREASKDGTMVQYPSGHRDRLDVAVRRAVLTGVNQTCAEISLHNMDAMGCDLVETTAHSGARPEHAVWQGRVFSRSGTHPKYPPFAASTGYGTGAGLCGWNCRHSFYPFFEGLSESAYPRDTLREYETRTVPYNGHDVPYYEATQYQRGLERSVHDTRRTLAGYDAAMKAGDGKLSAAMQGDFANASKTLKQREAKLKGFLQQTGLRKDTARVQVDGFGRSVSQRAVWANKKSFLTNAAGHPIIKVKQNDIRGVPNSITQKENVKGGIERNYYNQDGRQVVQIANNDHGKPKAHPFGAHGEHAHDYLWDDDGKPLHLAARELTDQEREENSDIL